MNVENAAPHLYPDENGPTAVVPSGEFERTAPKRWFPRRVYVTRDAREWPMPTRIRERVAGHAVEIIELESNRLPSLRGGTAREEYMRAKTTLAVVTSPPSHRKLQPIPPSADWQFHLARGCPAHCQYCYLAGSLDGAPLTRVYANLPEILDGLKVYEGTGTVTSRSNARAAEGTTFEASCYTDPLALEHLTGGVSEAIAYFGAWEAPVQLRWTTKFDEVDGFLGIAHHGRTRARFSVNALDITKRFEGGTAPLDARIAALAKLAHAGYPIGLTVAPIMPIPDWQRQYRELFEHVAAALKGVLDPDLTVELITHRFTPGSKDVLTGWYPATKLEMSEADRSQKRTKFGSLKYVYKPDTMRLLRGVIEGHITDVLPTARVLYWT